MARNTAPKESRRVNKATDVEGDTVAVHTKAGKHITNLNVADIQATKGRVVVEDREGKRATCYESAEGTWSLRGNTVVLRNN